MRFIYVLLIILVSHLSVFPESLTIPANTGYADRADTLSEEGRSWRNRVRFNRDGTVSQWKGNTESISWFGQFDRAGELKCILHWKQVPENHPGFKLTVGNKNLTKSFSNGSKLDFGSITISKPGYYRFKLESLNPDSSLSNGVMTSLELSDSENSSLIKNAHFNLKSRRNAASVHLFYPVKREKVKAFYCEMTAQEDPIWSYYMACGWHRGYFGMQVNSLQERRIIFSVWDSGGEPIDRNKVQESDRVSLMGKGEEVITKGFGNEGTGGHSHLKYMWRTGEKQKFVVTAEPVDQTFTIYSGFYFHPDKKKWVLISSWKAPMEGGYMRGLYSFSENFVGGNGHLVRKALYGNQWIQTPDDRWIELTTASFSHDGTGRSDRRDRFMGLENGEFYLSHGGFVDGFTAYGKKFSRPAQKEAPLLALPKIKMP